MTVRTIYSDPHDDLRAAIRALCAEFSDDYHRNNGPNRTYPVKSIDALTRLRTHNQNRTVAARAIADMKTFGHLS